MVCAESRIVERRAKRHDCAKGKEGNQSQWSKWVSISSGGEGERNGRNGRKAKSNEAQKLAVFSVLQEVLSKGSPSASPFYF